MLDSHDYLPPGAEDFAPHGACWLWNRWLIALHTIPDIVTVLAYFSIPIFLLYIYRQGHLKSLTIAFPKLWRLAIAFIFFCGLSHFGNVLEVWQGGSLYYITGINKVFMAVSSSWFAIVLVKRRNDLITIARVINRVSEQLNERDRAAIERDEAIAKFTGDGD